MYYEIFKIYFSGLLSFKNAGDKYAFLHPNWLFVFLFNSGLHMMRLLLWPVTPWKASMK